MKIPQEIVEFAKMRMLGGGCEPTLFVIGTKRKVSMPIPIGNDVGDRVQSMTTAGIQLAMTGVLGDVEQVLFVCEAWVSPARKQLVMPSQDPDRIEAILINALDPKTMAQTLLAYACVRDRKQEVIELKRMPMPEEGTAEGPLLRAFVAGFQLFRR